MIKGGIIMFCNKCGFEGTPNLEETGPHTKATCKKCGSYIKMLSKKEVENQIKHLSETKSKTIKEELIDIRDRIDILINKLPDIR